MSTITPGAATRSYSIASRSNLSISDNVTSTAPSDSFAPGLPEFAKDPLAQLLRSEIPQGLSKTPLQEADQQEAGKAVFVAGLLSSQDEVEGQDGAMGQPGKVVSNGLTCEFVSAGKDQLEAAIYGPGKTGEASALYVKTGPTGLVSYGFLDHGNSIEMRGQVVDGTGGYALSGTIPV